LLDLELKLKLQDKLGDDTRLPKELEQFLTSTLTKNQLRRFLEMKTQQDKDRVRLKHIEEVSRIYEAKKLQ